MTTTPWGPLAGLIGTWEGDQGLDVSFHNEEGKVGETPYFERSSFKAFGPVANGRQALYGLDYRMAAWRKGEEDANPFHTEIGYWLWDAEEHQVLRCFMVPRGAVVLAGGTAAPDATTVVLGAVRGQTTYGILSNEYLDLNAKTTQYDCTLSIDGDTVVYDQTTVYEHFRSDDPVIHTDHNRLHRVSHEA